MGEGNAPQDSQSKGRSPREQLIEMTSNNRCTKDKKHTARKSKKKARKPTYHENYGNNNASVRTNSNLFYILDWISLIQSELLVMNAGKPGRPFEYCDTMIAWIMTIMNYNAVTLRKASGIISGILRMHSLKAPHYTTILRRISRLLSKESVVLNDPKVLSAYVRPLTSRRKRRIAVDSTGLNLSDTTLWRENKWGVGPERRGWLKMHAAVDVDTNEILAYVLTEDNVGDNRMFIHLMDMVFDEGYVIGTVYADNAYEAGENWTYLHERNVRFVVRFKSNTVAHSNGCLERGESAKYWIMMGPSKWSKHVNYGRRWKVGAPEMAKKVSLKGATESGQRPSDRLSYFGRKRKEENSMTEKRKYLVPIKGDVPQGQHCIWLKLHCLNPRLLALTNMGAPLSGKIGICAQEVVLVDISILSSKVLNDLPASSKDVKGPKGKPKCNASTFSANQGLPKPYLIRHGNGVPIVVRPVNDWIYREGGQMNRFGNVGRCADANG